MLLAIEEGYFVDLKAVDIKPAKLTQFVSAFANASGGEIYIGIDELDRETEKTRRWRGFADPEAANGHIQPLEQMRPLGGHYRASFLECDGLAGLVLKLEIPKSRDVICASDGVPYVRRNAQKVPVNTPEGLERLRLDKGIISFEDERLNVPEARITNSRTILGFLLEVIPTAEPDAWLRKQELVVDGKPTVAGSLLFDDEPQAVLPKRSAIKIYRYMTKAEEGSRETLVDDPLTVEGCIYDLIYAAVAKTKNAVESAKRMTAKGLEAVTYPHETLHEIIANAVLHRDYSIPSDIHIRVFDNRIEVQSPGRLPGHVTANNILHEQAARNPKVVRLINKFRNPPNKDVGEGLNTAFNAMKAMRLRPPEITETDTATIVYIRHAALASPEQAVMEYLATHESITNGIARELTGIASENNMKRVFYALRDSKQIEPVPGKRGASSAWRRWTGGGSEEEPS